MATVVKEVHLKEKGISAPSTPRRILLSHGGQTAADYSPNGDIPMAKEKPKPNYLKPTISSCHDTSCGYPKSQQQHAAGARKRLISVKSMEKPAITSSLDKTPKERTTSRTDLSPKAVPERASKAPRVGKALARAKSFPKSMPKRREANGSPSTTITAIKPAEQEEKVIFVDSGVQGHAARHGSQAPKSNTEGKHRTSPEESDTGKPRAPPGKVSKKICGNEGAPKKVKILRGRERQGDGKEAVAKRLKFKQREKGVAVAGEEKPEQENVVVLKRPEVKEKDAPAAYNDVIEETAAKLATRRNKVRALVGAFESVISLQEPETQPSQRQQVAAVKVASGQPAQLKPEEEEEEGAERGQPARAKPEKEVKVAGVECYGRGEQQQPEEKGEKESGEEEMKGCQSVQENQPTETEEEESVIRKGEGERARE